MRPVADDIPVTQTFGSLATAGVIGDPNGSEVQQLVAAYGNYQPYGHAGQDIGAPIGTPVHAIAAGTVLWADWGTNLPGDETDGGYRQRWYLYKTFPGIVVVIQHNGWKGVYAHLSETPLNPGDTVTEGQQIALSGNTRSPGVSLGAHLHVEALIDDSYSTGNGLIYGRTDPTPYFGGGTISAQSITPSEEDPLATLTDEDKNNLFNALARIDAFCTNPPAAFVEAVAKRIFTRPVPYFDPATGKDTGMGTTLATFVGVGDYQHTATRTLIPPAVVKQLGATTPAGAPAAVDVAALVAQIKAELPPALVAELANHLTK